MQYQVLVLHIVVTTSGNLNQSIVSTIPLAGQQSSGGVAPGFGDSRPSRSVPGPMFVVGGTPASCRSAHSLSKVTYGDSKNAQGCCPELFRFHEVGEDVIDAGQVAFTLGLEPTENLRVKPGAHRSDDNRISCTCADPPRLSFRWRGLRALPESGLNEQCAIPDSEPRY